MNLSLIRNRHFLLLDALALLVMPALALVLRTESTDSLACSLSAGQRCYSLGIVTYTLVALAIRLSCFYFLGLYGRYWRYASIDDMVQIGVATFASSVGLLIYTAVILLGEVTPLYIPRSIPFIDGLLVFVYMGSSRFSLRFAVRWTRKRPQQGAIRVAVMGAGAAGAMIVRELQNNTQMNMQPVCFLDDDPRKKDIRIHGVPVLGNRQAIPQVVRDYGINRIIITMPSAPGKTIREILEICDQARVETKIIPGIYALLNGTVSINQIRDVDLEDLLRREPVQTNTQAVRQLLHGRRVLVTGGGGSIGSELCRQILAAEPQQLVLLGHGENSIFDIYNELLLQCPDEQVTDIQAVIADVRFPDRLQTVFNRYRPQVVFHTAAHKHVPLMELNPAEAITNNVYGTQNVLEACLASGVEHFVMISTDKAVNPTSVMGASKRTAELLVHAAAAQSGRPYVAVRFGNVLGSRGSVIHTFKQQIANGGPLTITHPEMTRYFMTIPEAVQLVLQAAVLGHGGEVFVLDMGEPVRILDLAHDLIKLSGLEVEQDIEIKFTGLRPGEKLYEELFVAGEKYHRTHHEKIFIAGNGTQIVPQQLSDSVQALVAAARRNDAVAIRRLLKGLIPEYTPAGPIATTTPYTNGTPVIKTETPAPTHGLSFTS